jgi:AraC-like DNA-binding protein
MIHGLGQYRRYRLAAALDRLNALPPQSQLSLTKAAHLLGISETQLRALLRRYGPASANEGKLIGAATLRHVIRQAREARRRS